MGQQASISSQTENTDTDISKTLSEENPENIDESVSEGNNVLSSEINKTELNNDNFISDFEKTMNDIAFIDKEDIKNINIEVISLDPTNYLYEIDPDLDDVSKENHLKIRNLKKYKITNKDEKHHMFQYNDGKNILDQEFNTDSRCGPGGLYFATEGDILNFLDYGIFVREVFLCPDSKLIFVNDDCSKYKTDKFILGPKKLISLEFIEEQIAIAKSLNIKYDKYLVKMYDSYYELNKYITDDMTEEQISPIIENFLKEKESYCKKYIFIKSEIARNVLYKKLGYLYKYPSSIFVDFYNPSDEVIIEFAKHNPKCLEFVKHFNHELMMFAKDHCPEIFKKIEIDRESVKKFASEFVDNKCYYKIAYLKEIHNKIQKELMEITPLNIILIENPDEEIIEKCKDHPDAHIYYEMYKEKNENICDKQYLNLYSSKFDQFYIDKDYFLGSLKESNGYVGGSFAQASVTGENILCNDIDVFVNNEEDALKFQKKMKKYNYIKYDEIAYSDYAIMGVNIKKIIILKRKIRFNTKYIQIVIINKNIDPRNYIMMCTDLECCRCVFDGYSNVYFPLKKGEIFTKHTLNIFDMYAKNMNELKKNLSSDKVKYYNSLLTQMNKYISKCERRIMKYDIKYDSSNLKTFYEMKKNIVAEFTVVRTN